MKSRDGFLLGSVSTLALALISQPGLAAPENQTDKGAVLEEVTVTAQRRTERSLDVPIAITALSAEQLGRGDVLKLGDIGKLTPGLRFDDLGANSQPTIRGVGTAVVVAGASNNVAIYTDGFYSPNMLMADSELLNVESIQVLKGPQGTLFGRNSTGGAILVTTSDPSSEEEFRVRASYGSYNAERYEIYGTGGADDRLAVDIAAMFRKGDGFLENIYTGDDTVGAYENWTVRPGVKWDVSDKTSITLRYSYAKTNDPTPVMGTAYEKDGVIQSTAVFWDSPINFGTGTLRVATEPYDVSYDYKPQYTSNSKATQLTIKSDLDFANFTSYTQYRSESGTHTYDFDLSSMPLNSYIFTTTDEVITQEFLLSSAQDGPLQWTTGMFYLSDKTTYPRNLSSVSGGPFIITQGSGVKATSIALFADITYAVMNNLYWTVGARYSKDKSTDAHYYTGAGNARVKVPIDDLDDSNVTPRTALRYEPNDHSSIYISYSEGIKSSILNVGAGSLANTFDIEVEPEEIKSYELGYKYNQGSLMFDVTAFYYEYTNLQVAGYIGYSTIIENAAESNISGLEAQTRYAFNEKFEANFGIAVLDAEYDKFERSQYRYQCITSPIFGFCPDGVFYGQYGTKFGDASGKDMLRSPEVTATLGANYRTPLGGGQLGLSGNLYYTSSFFFDSHERYKEEGYQLLSLRAEWTDPSEVYTFAVYGDNLTDEEYRTQVLPQFYGPLVTWGSPRTYGVSIAANFK